MPVKGAFHLREIVCVPWHRAISFKRAALRRCCLDRSRQHCKSRREAARKGPEVPRKEPQHPSISLYILWRLQGWKFVANGLAFDEFFGFVGVFIQNPTNLLFPFPDIRGFQHIRVAED